MSVELIAKYKDSYNYKENPYPDTQVGVWEVRGEDPNCDFGGALLQQVNRDTCNFAMKCSAICVDGEWRDVYKDPVGDSGKKSKRGRQSTEDMALRIVDGYIINETTLEGIRARVAEFLS